MKAATGLRNSPRVVLGVLFRLFLVVFTEEGTDDVSICSPAGDARRGRGAPAAGVRAIFGGYKEEIATGVLRATITAAST